MTISKKTIALLMALVLVLGAGIGGTIAWLSTQTATVTNTFVKGEIGTLKLEESDTTAISVTEGDEDKTHSNFIVVPGVDLVKDPSVTFTPVAGTEQNPANNVPVFVFVEIALDQGSNWTISGNNLVYKIPAGTGENAPAALDNALKCSVASGWTAVTGTTGVYYKALAAGTPLEAAAVLTELDSTAHTTIDVSGDITKEQLANLTKTDLKFKAYAIQQEGFTGDNEAAKAATAWAALNPTTSNTNP